ncbi:hypothetical protein FG379_000046 [Cryptosporidium bovis]|uniref:uncharacterized protein n=1 Tax=Cryptosporidium bovis TaxID=310047 RepID=UPI00351A8198|nr:hypothetical protein FG379_000046 [Cryptosporidium bovis]
MRWIFELFMFVTSFCIPLYHSLNALKTQNNYLIRIWLFYFTIITVYYLFLSYLIEPILNFIDPRLKHFKTIFILLYIFPITGLQESCSNFIDEYFVSPIPGKDSVFHDITKENSDYSGEITPGSHSPTPSIPEEGVIKVLINPKLSTSENSTLVPNTPTEKNKNQPEY